LRKNERECSDLRFLCSQYLQKIQIEQRQAEQERDRVDAIIKKEMEKEKNHSGKTGPKGIGAGRKFIKLIPKVPRLEMETPLSESVIPPSNDPPTAVNLDIVKISEERNKTLEKKNQDYQMRLTDLENEIQLLKTSLINRDSEIKRLGAQLESSKVHQFDYLQNNKVEGMTQNPASRQRVDQLEMQIEQLHEYVENLEKVNIF
jgi:hypothetical protein